MIVRSAEEWNSTPSSAIALNYFAYNFIKIYRTLRTSPAMAAGVYQQALGSLRPGGVA